MPKVRLHRQLARWVVACALAVPLTGLVRGPVPALSAAAPLGATVSVLSLPVEVATTDPDAVFSTAIDGQTLSEGDTVRTGPGGMALVTFFDGSESQLGGESQVQIEQVRATPAPQIAFLQTAGVTVNHVIPMPTEGSFRTDTPAATGLVRGTSYIVIVGSAGTCGATGDGSCVASMILLTDRNGHVGRVDVSANGSSVAAVPLARAGDAAAASNSFTAAAHLEPAVLAHLESVAHVRNDPTASLATEEDARAIAAMLVPLATAPATTADTSTAGNPVQPAPIPATPPVAETRDHTDGAGQGNSSAAHSPAPAAPAPAGHANTALAPKVVAPATVSAPPHVDTSKASASSAATSAIVTTTSSRAAPSASADPGTAAQSAKPAEKAADKVAAPPTSGSKGNSNS